MCRSFFVLTVSVLSLSNVAFAAPLYSIKDLTPAGYTGSVAFDINSDGDAVGVAERFVSGSHEEAYFYYDHSAGTSTVFGVGTVSPRSAITGTGFRDVAINDSGQIAGTAVFAGGSPQRRGFIYSGGTSGTFTNLGVFPPGSGLRPASDAIDINASGVATGTATSGVATSDNVDAYTGSASPVSDFDGDTTVVTKGDRGRAINNAGLVAGSNQDGKAMVALGLTETAFLSGTSLASDLSFATDLNEVGQVTGGTISNASFIYNTTDTSLRILPNLDPAASRVQAKAINESGDTVGWGDRGGGLSDQARGFVHDYSENKSYILEDHVLLTGSTVTGLSDWGDLNTAWGINDSGWIVGVGDRRFDGATFPNPRAYLLIPVPEPSTIALFSLAGLLLASNTSRSNRREFE